MRLTSPDGTTFRAATGASRAGFAVRRLALDAGAARRRARRGCAVREGVARPRAPASTRDAVAGVEAERDGRAARRPGPARGRGRRPPQRGRAPPGPAARAPEAAALRGARPLGGGRGLEERRRDARGRGRLLRHRTALADARANVAFVLDPRELRRRRGDLEGFYRRTLRLALAAARGAARAGASPRAAARDRPARPPLPGGVRPGRGAGGRRRRLLRPVHGRGRDARAAGAELAAAAAAAELARGGARAPAEALRLRAGARGRHARQVPLQPPAPARGGLAGRSPTRSRAGSPPARPRRPAGRHRRRLRARPRGPRARASCSSCSRPDGRARLW